MMLNEIPGYKVVIFGDQGVGKKTFLKIGAKEMFKSNSKMTIGVDFFTKYIEVDRKRMKLQIWNFGGENRFQFYRW